MATKRTGPIHKMKAPGWTPFALVRRRIIHFWVEQIRVWRTVLDWTVWVYFVLPAVFIGGGTWLEWWRQPPDWMQLIPLAAAVLPAIVQLLSTRLRVFVDEGDALFLVQRLDWMRGLIAFGAYYSAAGVMLTTALAFALLLPLLVGVHNLPLSTVLVWGAMVSAVRAAFAVAESVIRVRWSGWKRYAIVAPAWLLAASALAGSAAVTSHPGLLAGGIAAAVVLSAWLLRLRLRVRGAFEGDVARERKARLAGTELLLMGGGVLERKPVARLRRPLLFRRSERLFRRSDPGTILAEMRIKAFLRKWTSVRLWLSFVGVSTAAMLAAPSWMDLMLLALLPIPAAVWLHGHWKDWFDGDYVKQFRWDDLTAIRGATLSRFWLLVPAIAWLSLLAGWRAAGAAGMLLTAAAGVGCWYALNGLLGVVMTVRKK